MWAGGRDSSEKRTLFSEVRGDESSAVARAAEGVASSDVLGESRAVDAFTAESRSLHSSATASVRASSSSKNSSKVVSGTWRMRYEHVCCTHLFINLSTDSEVSLISHLEVVSHFIFLPSKKKKGSLALKFLSDCVKLQNQASINENNKKTSYK